MYVSNDVAEPTNDVGYHNDDEGLSKGEMIALGLEPLALQQLSSTMLTKTTILPRQQDHCALPVQLTILQLEPVINFS